MVFLENKVFVLHRKKTLYFLPLCFCHYLSASPQLALYREAVPLSSITVFRKAANFLTLIYLFPGATNGGVQRGCSDGRRGSDVHFGSIGSVSADNVAGAGDSLSTGHNCGCVRPAVAADSV